MRCLSRHQRKECVYNTSGRAASIQTTSRREIIVPIHDTYVTTTDGNFDGIIPVEPPSDFGACTEHSEVPFLSQHSNPTSMKLHHTLDL